MRFAPLGFSSPEEPGSPCPFFKGDEQVSTEAADKLQNRAGHGFQDQLLMTLPAELIAAIVAVSLWTSMPTYFVLSIDGAPFCRGMRSTLKPYRKRGAPL